MAERVAKTRPVAARRVPTRVGRPRRRSATQQGNPPADYATHQSNPPAEYATRTCHLSHAPPPRVFHDRDVATIG